MKTVWHRSPLWDAGFYHFSWFPAALICLLIKLHFGVQAPFYIYLLWPITTHLHRWYTIPYAYLDGEVFSHSRRTLLIFPSVLLALLFALPLVLGLSERVGLPLYVLMAAVTFVRVTWDTWHSLMQKFGILRMYNGRGKLEAGAEVARWTDFLMLISWGPLIGASHASDGIVKFKAIRNDRVAGLPVREFLLWVVEHQTALVVASSLLVAVVIGVWLQHEYRVFRFRNRARLSLLTGQSLMMITILFVDPVSAVAIGATSHAVEYLAYVTNTQRKRYAVSPGRETLLARIDRKPLLMLVLFVVIPLCIWYFNRATLKTHSVFFAGVSLSAWFFFGTSFESFAHYFIDGVIWKLRKPEYRASLV